MAESANSNLKFVSTNIKIERWQPYWKMAESAKSNLKLLRFNLDVQRWQPY